MKKHLTVADLTWKLIEEVVQKEGKGGFIFEYILYKKWLPYKEPKRKGTPKGKKIGFSGKKYFANILVGITNRKLKDIAKQSEVSYGLLRKWKTEYDFQTEAENHCSEFVDEIIKRIKTQLKKRRKAFEDFYDRNGIDPLKKDLESPLDASERILIDAHLFNDKVLNRLEEVAFKIILEALKEAQDKEFDEIYFSYALSKKIRDVISYAKTKDFSLHHPFVAKRLVDEVKEVISAKRTLSEKEQKMIIHNLKFIENELNAIYKFLNKDIKQTKGKNKRGKTVKSSKQKTTST